MRRTSYFTGLLLAICIFLTQCSKDEPSTPILPTVDPNNREALAKEITFTSSTTQVAGNVPTSSPAGPSTPTISNIPSASVVASGTVYIPVTYNSPAAPSALYVQVVGATTFYFSIPLPGAGASGTVTVPMTISSRVLVGDFSMAICVLTGSSLSQPYTVFASVTEPLACGNGSVSGSEGVTNTRHALDGKSGTVNITYDTYSVPDRIDVFLDGNVWKGGTGTTITPPPPTSTCSSPLPGFVGASGTISFAVTTSNKYIDVYVSGCLGSGTAWTYSLTCP
ncbi:MAG: hypothetical protein SH819_14150 [Cytophagales bacterium]|nr:hypothetical protein [Cytophagales bacterium]